MEREAALAAYNDLHEDAQWHDGTFRSWTKKRDAEHPYRFDFGVKIGVAETDLAPWDKFTTERDASPVKPAEDESSDG